MNAANNKLIFATMLLLTTWTMAGCGGGAAAEPVEDSGEAFMMEEAPAAEPADTGADVSGVDVAGGATVVEGQPADDTQGTTFQVSGGQQVGVSSQTQRLIIKNGEMRLLVQETDTAIGRLTQIVGDFGGYIISSREWFQEWDGENYKFATYTFAVPVDQFERALGRLRNIAIRVLDEQASGEDVTQEFVDLESRLRNLEATRDRIREFLDQADTVEEALRVNQELSNVEDQIEETRGRMNYLSGRAAFSTITVTLEPELPEIVPTPTPTPRPTATPTPWSPGTTFNNATDTLSSAYQGIVNFAIWLFVVIVPVLAPFALIGWAIWRITSPNRASAKDKKVPKN